jgi:hypothetical protein
MLTHYQADQDGNEANHRENQAHGQVDMVLGRLVPVMGAGRQGKENGGEDKPQPRLLQRRKVNWYRIAAAQHVRDYRPGIYASSWGISGIFYVLGECAELNQDWLTSLRKLPRKRLSEAPVKSLSWRFVLAAFRRMIPARLPISSSRKTSILKVVEKTSGIWPFKMALEQQV